MEAHDPSIGTPGVSQSAQHLSIKLCSTEEVDTRYRNNLKINLGAAALGIILLVAVAVWNRMLDAAQNSPTGWQSFVQLLMIVGGFALLVGGGRGILHAIDERRAVHKFYTERWPHFHLKCPHCSKDIIISRHNYQYQCSKCGTENKVTAYGEGSGKTPKILMEQGWKCVRCATPNPLAGRSVWFTCPYCNTKHSFKTMPDLETSELNAEQVKQFLVS